jgi:hypothetical protein
MAGRQPELRSLPRSIPRRNSRNNPSKLRRLVLRMVRPKLIRSPMRKKNTSKGRGTRNMKTTLEEDTTKSNLTEMTAKRDLRELTTRTIALRPENGRIGLSDRNLTT